MKSVGFAQVPAPSMAALADSAEGSVELTIPKVRKGFCVSSDLISGITFGKTPPGPISLHSQVTQHPEVHSAVQEMLLPTAVWMGKLLAKLCFLSPVRLSWSHLSGRARARAGCSLPVRASSDLGISGRVFWQEVWQFAWPGACLSPMDALPPGDEAAVWRGAAITAPQGDGFGTQGSAAPGVCVFVS